MRLNYVPNPPTDLSPDDQAVLERVKARRGPNGLIPLDLTLLHSPAVTDGSFVPPQVRRSSLSWLERRQCHLMDPMTRAQALMQESHS
jgi:hypothetical protein